MTEKRFELKLCSNRTYYVYENGTLTDIDFDKFNKESADGLIDELNALYDENEQLKQDRNEMFIRERDTKNELRDIQEENEQLKKKILEEIDLEVAYVNETYSDGRMSKEQHNGAIISLRQLREKFE